MYTVLKNKKIEYEAIGIQMLIDDEKQNVAIITPIMRRFHAMDFSKDIIFVDSSGSCDQTNTVVTFFLDHPKLGAYLWAWFFILVKARTIIRQHLNFLKSLLALMDLMEGVNQT